LSGFVLKEIETDKITMVRGEEKLIVAMNDPQKAKAREVAAMTAAATPKQPQATIQQRAPVKPQERTKTQQAPAPEVSAGQGAVVQPPSAPSATQRKGGGFGGLFQIPR
jgi:peptidoglycan hydrolase CwlO-like protein